MADEGLGEIHTDIKNVESLHDAAIKWKPISLTYVEYQAGDFLGFLLAWSSMLPIFILIAFGTLVVFRRDLHTICYLFGLLLNEVINWVLKRIIKEPRPLVRDTIHNEYGMPSSHSQFMWFFATYLCIFLYIRVHHNYHLIENIWKYMVSFGGIIVALVVAYSRVYLKYHSCSQVFWGAVIGVSLGILWFTVVQFVLTPFFPIVAAWRVSEFFMIRDSTLIPNVLWFEYCSSRAEARNRQRKLTSRKSL